MVLKLISGLIILSWSPSIGFFTASSSITTSMISKILSYTIKMIMPAHMHIGPVSVTALIGTNAHFQCAGAGNSLVWEVDGLPHYHSDIVQRGITAATLPSSGTVQSNLTVPATPVNNNTMIRCAISSSLFSTVVSNFSTLTVLPGTVRS